jgi:hypothetical protein
MTRWKPLIALFAVLVLAGCANPELTKVTLCEQWETAYSRLTDYGEAGRLSNDDIHGIRLMNNSAKAICLENPGSNSGSLQDLLRRARQIQNEVKNG